MGWQLFRLTYELLSPLHIGYHKVGNVQRTRYYVPARNLWAAVTERLTRSGFDLPAVAKGDYRRVGEWVQKHCAFSYFFLCEGDELLNPCYTAEGLRYGDFSAAEFERRYLSAHVSTALDAATTSARQGSLHEIEFIAPYHPANPGGSERVARTRLCGWVFLDQEGIHLLGDEQRWRNWLNELQIGGERRYGFGSLRVKEGPEAAQQLAYGEHHDIQLGGARPQIKVPTCGPLLAHTAVQGIEARGMIEPLVGRETRRDSQGFGQALTPARLSWQPGSVIKQEQWLTLDETGMWRVC